MVREWPRPTGNISGLSGRGGVKPPAVEPPSGLRSKAAAAAAAETPAGAAGAVVAAAGAGESTARFGPSPHPSGDSGGWTATVSGPSRNAEETSHPQATPPPWWCCCWCWCCCRCCSRHHCAGCRASRSCGCPGLFQHTIPLVRRAERRGRSACCCYSTASPPGQNRRG